MPLGALTSVIALAAFGLPAAPANAAAQSLRLAGTSSAQTGSFAPAGAGDITQVEFPGQLDSAQGPAPYSGSIVNRSNSGGSGPGVTVHSGQKAKSAPQLGSSFEGLNLYQQRFARGGNQFTVEPPDQALCVGNGFVLEAVNDVLNVYSPSGQSVLPDNTAVNVVAGFPRDVNHAVDLNSFYGYAPAINRTTGVRAQFVTDPSCLYDAVTQRFFVTALTLETNPNGSFTLANHLDIAVSQTSNPTGSWNIYRLDVTGDGSNPDPANACPCLGDYPHIGADANGFYVTTNAYPWAGSGFDGAQIYALSKAQLAAGAANVNLVHVNTFGTVAVPSDVGASQPGFTVWPAQSPGTGSFEAAANGTEYLMSSNAADEAKRPVAGVGGDHTSRQIVVWALTNTSSLNTASPLLSLTNQVIGANQYAVPPTQQQPGSGTAPTTATPQGRCINDTATVLFTGQLGCWRLLVGGEPAHNEVISRPDSNDTRMQQVTYANGKLWGALDTALNPDGGPQRAGLAWYVVKPDVSTGTLAAKMALQGYLGVAGADLTYPAIAVTPSGRGVMGFTYTSDSVYPSAAYAPIDAVVGAGPWSIAGPGGQGAATHDGFTGYQAQVGNPPRTRWGEYGAAAVDGKSVWIASEYIAHACDFPIWVVPSSPAEPETTSSAPAPGPTTGRAPGRHSATGPQLVHTDQPAHPLTSEPGSGGLRWEPG
ncbi:hypothetical protein V3N99_06555 [Dermatophilaceae bacterium Soc4.6]